MTRGLAAAHRSGVIHRDLKPDNIFLSVSSFDGAREPRPKILDFGISKISALTSEANPALTREGVVMGTPHYMAPEQLRSHKLDERCDIYALGVILYQMLSGKLPFTSDNFPDLMLKIVSEAPESLAKLVPELPRELIAIVKTALSRSAAERFESAADLGRALEPFGQGASFDVEQPATIRPPSSFMPGPTTPVATESRFPSTDELHVTALQRARRLAVPLAASAASAALACWLYVSFDNQQAAASAVAPERPAAASGDSPARPSAPLAAQHATSQPVKDELTEELATTRSELELLPEPNVQPYGHELASASGDTTAPEEPPSLIGALALPQLTGAIAAPAPVPPPGAAAALGAASNTDKLDVAQARSEPKSKKPASKKQASKYESPEIRMNDFFK